MLRANTRARHTREHALSPRRKELNASGRVSRTKVSAAFVCWRGTSACVGLQSRKYMACGSSLPANASVMCHLYTPKQHTDPHILNLKLWVCS